MKTSQNGVNFIASFEGCELTAYRCPANVLTIGYGHTGADVHEGQIITKQKALELLANDLAGVEARINGLDLKLNQNQFDALVSFAYNCGFGNLKKSTLLEFVKANPNNTNIVTEFMKWTRANGKVLPGLVRRRHDEAALYFKKNR